MIIENTLKFGYGDISVGSDCVRQSIIFQQFKPCLECGNIVPKDVDFIGEKIVLEISYDEYCEINKNLVKVSNKEITKFIFKGYSFDFTNFNEKSIKVCKKHLDKAMEMYFLCLAA